MALLRPACIVILLVVAASVVQAYKIAIFFPDIANSQIIWNHRLAETLQKSGHDVTLVRLLMAPVDKKELPRKEGIQEWKFYGYNDSSNVPNVAEVVSSAYEEVPLWSASFRKRTALLGGMMINSCEVFVQNKDLLKRLKDAKFDLAFADMTGLCFVGLIHYAKIPTWIAMNNAPLLDFVADLAGAHSPSSYVPPVNSDFSDTMTFTERLQSFLSWTIMPVLFKRFVAERQTAIFRKHVDPKFPSLANLVTNCPLIMVNSEEMYAAARPVLHKIVYVGGLGMNREAAKPLTGELGQIANKTSDIIVFAFGSIANASLMPQKWKDAFTQSFRKFPDVEFILRYEADDLNGKLPPNVHTYKWIPQTDLLHLPKTRALITHGGFNSMQEAINAGTPMIVIPLFGDQPTNAKLVLKHRLGVVLKKSEISEEVITDAVREILEDNSYAKAMQRMRDMIRKKPFKPEEQVIRWTKFVAEFKNLPNLVPHGAKLGFVRYYCVDVVAFLLLVFSALLYVVYRLLCYILSLCSKKFCSQKRKKE